MARESVGTVACPFCGGQASVFRNARSSRLLYFRCGEVVSGVSSGCGTVQIYGATGQAWIAKNMAGDPLGSADPVPDPVSDPIPDPVADPVPDPFITQAPARSSIWSRAAALLSED